MMIANIDWFIVTLHQELLVRGVCSNGIESSDVMMESVFVFYSSFRSKEIENMSCWWIWKESCSFMCKCLDCWMKMMSRTSTTCLLLIPHSMLQCLSWWRCLPTVALNWLASLLPSQSTPQPKMSFLANLLTLLMYPVSLIRLVFRVLLQSRYL